MKTKNLQLLLAGLLALVVAALPVRADVTTTPAANPAWPAAPLTATTITGTTITATTKFLAADGSAAAPSYSFSGSTGNGFYNVGNLASVSGGVIQWLQAPSIFRFTSTVAVGWSSGDPSALASDIVLSRYAPKQLMISGDGTGTASGMTGFILGSFDNAGTQSALWHSGDTPSGTNYRLYSQTAGPTYINSVDEVGIRINNSSKFLQVSTAGAGPSITAGTATADVNALSVTQTWNAAGVTFTANKTNVTNTASAAGSLLEDWQIGGVSKASIGLAGDIKIGNTLNSVSPTAPNRTITMVVGGVTVYIAAKTTND